MQYITVNYSLNQIYNVHIDAFKEATEMLIKKNKNIELVDELVLNIVRGGKNIEIEVKVNILNSADAAQTIKDFSKSIENSVSDLINCKPSNLSIEINSIK